MAILDVLMELENHNSTVLLPADYTLLNRTFLMHRFALRYRFAIRNILNSQ